MSSDPAAGRGRELDRELIVVVREREAGVVLTVDGDLDFDNSPRLRTTVTRLALTPGQLLVLDLSGVTFFDSSGVTVLIIARKVAMAARAEIAVSGVSPMVEKIFRITGLDRVFRSFPDPDAAFAARFPGVPE